MKIRALVFEDNDQLRSLISTILEMRGYEVFTFSEPGSCPLYLKDKCPCPLKHTCADIIITDINMPSVTGLDFKILGNWLDDCEKRIDSERKLSDWWFKHKKT